MSILYCLSYYKLSGIKTIIDEIHRDHVTDCIMREVAFTGITCIIAWVTEASIAGEIRLSLQYLESSRGEATAKSLLSVLCDATVHLDSHLRITRPAPQFAALLLRPESALSMCCITDLMLEQDHDRFEQNILHAHSTSPGLLSKGVHEHAVSLSISLREARGGAVPVRLVSSSFLDLDNELHYIIGICEMEHLSRTAREALCHASKEVLEHVASPLDVAEVAEIRSESSRSSSRSSSSRLSCPSYMQAHQIC